MIYELAAGWRCFHIFKLGMTTPQVLHFLSGLKALRYHCHSILGFSSCAKLTVGPRFFFLAFGAAQSNGAAAPGGRLTLVERKSYAGWDLNIILLLTMDVHLLKKSEREATKRSVL